ncbi:hypothetical protein CCMA1212_006298 [Trichoderma ghanense]|uniref:Peptidase A1 domain-containing protein n=1 Tax=Trichoderma ghanense TaxID=65468 RepID=A0ABY2H2S6_9HYPO
MPSLSELLASLLPAGNVATSSNLPDGVIRVPLQRIMNQSFYGMEFEVGNPPQRSWLKIDTGSPTIGFVSPRSNLCLRPDAPCEALGTYDNLTSSTAVVAFPDGGYPNYSDGLLDGANGILVNDTLTQVNPFAGIMGLSAICFDSSCTVCPTLVQQLADQGIMQTRAFSIYLGENRPDAVGHLLIGGVDEAKREGPVFTQKLDKPWGMEYLSFTLDKDGKKTVWSMGPGNETDWDTGASYWGLPTDVFNAVAAELGCLKALARWRRTAMSPILSVSTKIEIAASPAAVRSVFLDFARYTQWQPGWNIQPADASKQPLDLKAGDGLKVNMNGNVHHPVVVWEGSLFGLAKGVHQFHFTPSETNPGNTTFTQGEDFRGLLITLSSPWWNSRKFDLGPWDKFNADLKSEVEKSLK